MDPRLDVIMMGGAAVRAVTKALEANSIVGLLCDLDQGPGVDVRFFGAAPLCPAASLPLR